MNDWCVKQAEYFCIKNIANIAKQANLLTRAEKLLENSGVCVEAAGVQDGVLSAMKFGDLPLQILKYRVWRHLRTDLHFFNFITVGFLIYLILGACQCVCVCVSVYESRESNRPLSLLKDTFLQHLLHCILFYLRYVL
jgi:hypothetical protein